MNSEGVILNKLGTEKKDTVSFSHMHGFNKSYLTEAAE